jgi:hypothetical protein
MVLGGTLWCAVSVCIAADPKNDSGPRIIPATKSQWGVAANSYEEPKPRRAGKPDNEVPPLPGEPMPGVGRQQAHQMRIIPSRDSSAADFQRFERIYRSIPYRRLAYQANPRYREELAMALLFNQFPPPPTYIMPGGDSGMGQGGGAMPSSGGRPPMGDPLRWMLTVPSQWLF